MIRSQTTTRSFDFWISRSHKAMRLFILILLGLLYRSPVTILDFNLENFRQKKQLNLHTFLNELKVI